MSLARVRPKMLISRYTEDSRHGAGKLLPFFPLRGKASVPVGARIVRVAIDHLGIEFGPGQDAVIAELLATLSPG